MGWMPVSLLPPTYNACLERLDLGEEIPPPAEDQESNNGPYTLIKNFFSSSVTGFPITGDKKTSMIKNLLHSKEEGIRSGNEAVIKWAGKGGEIEVCRWLRLMAPPKYLPPFPFSSSLSPLPLFSSDSNSSVNSHQPYTLLPRNRALEQKEK